MKVLVTGGAGYIGSHTIVDLLNKGYEVVVVDNLVNSDRHVINRIEEMTGKSVSFYEADVRNTVALSEILNNHTIDAMMHFAGLKAVGESTEKPLLYYQVNIGGTLALLEMMQQYKIKHFVFSSSAVVYGSAPVPYTEASIVGQGIANTYGQTKYMVEQMMIDIAHANPDVQFTALRYFNPIGAHASGRIGEYPDGIPNNLMPYITQVATGQREKLRIFGNDYNTIDGTGVRDYIHVSDLASGHVAALTHHKPGFHAYNLGSGKGVSVLQLVKAFEDASGKEIPYEIVDRRPGDIDEYYSDASLAAQELGWKTDKSLEDACRDSWNWISSNPNGYN